MSREPRAADPDSPGRTVDRPPLNRGVALPPEMIEEGITPTGGQDPQLERFYPDTRSEAERRAALEGRIDQALFHIGKELPAAVEELARGLAEEKAGKLLEKRERAELLEAQHHLDWLARWRQRVEIRRQRDRARRALEAADQALQVLGE